MDAKERFLWDLNGHLIVRNVLSEEDLNAANDAIDFCADRITPGEANRLSRGSTFLQGQGRPGMRGINLLDIEKPHCDIFRRLLVHPAIMSRLKVMCGRGFRLDHGPQFIGGIKGTSGHALHGSGAPHRPYVAYRNQHGEMHCAGVTVSWQLSEIPEGKGGFACVPGSHKSDFDMPEGVRTVDGDMGTSINPEAQPGDAVFFMDGAQTHGTYPWVNDHERRSILYKFASRTAVRTGVSVQIAPPEIYWEENIVDGMISEERAVMYGPCSGHGGMVPSLDITEDGTVIVEGGDEAKAPPTPDGLPQRRSQEATPAG